VKLISAFFQLFVANMLKINIATCTIQDALSMNVKSNSQMIKKNLIFSLENVLTFEKLVTSDI
jgi:hypothetical protein